MPDESKLIQHLINRFAEKIPDEGLCWHISYFTQYLAIHAVRQMARNNSSDHGRQNRQMERRRLRQSKRDPTVHINNQLITRPSSGSVSLHDSPIVVLTSVYGRSFQTIFDVPLTLNVRKHQATRSFTFRCCKFCHSGLNRSPRMGAILP